MPARRRRLTVLLPLAVLGSTAPAGAATVSYDAGTGLRITAGAGETNRISFESEARGDGLEIRVADAGTTPTPGGGCRAGASASVVVCVLPIGTGANYVLTADLGDGDDVFEGGGYVVETGDTFITAGPGDDDVRTGSSFDAVDLGPGNDTVETRGGNDSVIAGPGNDYVFGGGGNDRYEGGDGTDTIDYSRGVHSAIVFLDGTRPTLKRNAPRQVNAQDTISSFAVAIGSANGDTLVGTSGIDRLEGRDGPDKIFGDPEAHRLFDPDAANPRMASRAACCFTTVPPSKAPTSPGPAAQPPRVVTFPAVQLNVRIRLADVLLGGPSNDELYGSVLGDDINGEAGEDLVDGRGGDDLIFGRDGTRDRIDCGTGTDAATADLRDEYDEGRNTCESFDRGALREYGHVRFGPRSPKLSRGTLTLRLSCPKGTPRGCAGRLSARAGGRTGATTRYAIRAGATRTVRAKVPGSGRTIVLRSVERGSFGDRTTIRTLRRS